MRVNRVPLVVVSVLVAVGMLAGCSSDSDSGEAKPVDRTAVLTKVTDQVIEPAMTHLVETAINLSADVTALCEEPSEDGLEKAKAAWVETRTAWSGTAAFQFGPAVKLHSKAKIAYPIRDTKLEAMFEPGGQAVNGIDRAMLTTLGADARGLGALEILLFGPRSVDELIPAKCDYADAAAADVAAGASELSHTWGSEPLGDEQERVNDLLNGAISALSTVIDMTLAPISREAVDKPDAVAADPGKANNAVADATAMVDSAEQVYEGLSPLVKAKSSKADASATAGFDAALDSIKAIPTPLAGIDVTDKATIKLVDRAYDKTVAVRRLLRTEVASQLGVTISFSDSDGDG